MEKLEKLKQKLYNDDEKYNALVDKLCNEYENRINEIIFSMKSINEMHREMIIEQSRKHNRKIASMMDEYPGCLG